MIGPVSIPLFFVVVRELKRTWKLGVLFGRNRLISMSTGGLMDYISVLLIL